MFLEKKGTSFLFDCTSIQAASRYNRQHWCLCGVTHKFMCVPLFKVVHYTQIDITFLTDTQCAAICFSVKMHDTVLLWNASVMDVSLVIHFGGTLSIPGYSTSCHNSFPPMDDQIAK